jgi:serine/threonine-protein kinase
MTPPQETDPELSSLDPLPGRVVAGNFRIEKLIGAGAMGNVYKAEQLSLGKAVAVKVLHQHLMGDEKLVARFKREAKSASMLNHPNSIQIIDSGEDRDGTLYIAMELLTGRDLAEVIRDDFPLPLPRVVRIMTQVLSALDEAHAHGVIHRDLKPSNIMLIERRGQPDFVKVCDFGIAKATLADKEDRDAMLTIQGLVCGTPEYMSPEQARAENIDGRTDLYSAAVILYQMVTGDIPFRADSPMGVLSRHLAESPIPPSKRRPDLRIPKAVDDIVLRGMDKNRELRFATAVAFRDALEVMLNTALGFPSPLPASIRAALPTARDISGAFDSLGGIAGTAMLPAQGAADRFGTTANMTGRRRGNKGIVLAFVAVAAIASVAGALFTARARREMAQTPPTAVAKSAAAALPSPAPAPAAAPPEAPKEEAAEAVPAAAVAPVAEPAPPSPAEAPAPPARPAHARHHHGHQVTTASAGASEPAAPAAAAPIPTAAATPPATPASTEAAPRGPRDALTEAERLLAQGEVTDACARGEEAKRLGPRMPAVYKFLGKCYMRAGRAGDANDNYKQYLGLAPNAPDAPFVKSIIK